MVFVLPSRDTTVHPIGIYCILPSGHVKVVGSIIRDYAMREDGDDPSRQTSLYGETHRPIKRHSCWLHCQYISKNIDGYGLMVKKSAPGVFVSRLVGRL